MTGGQPDRAIDAVIFDLDGVLADTEIIWFEAMRALLAPAEFTWEQNLHLVGSTSEFTTEWIRTEFQRTESPADLERIIGAAVNEHVERVTLEPMAGATELVEGLRSRGLPVAVASQSSPRWVERTLRQIGLLPAFEFFVTASEVPRGKPAPDIYLHAAARIGVAPERCLAIEDSSHGIESAHAAGFSVVQIRHGVAPSPPQERAHAIIESLHAFDFGWLHRPPRR
ncbi:MAG: HAD family phosphatase [Chloroflexi bacterium]|nr:HAD family phosphatase [Chloroflexota bacterium]MDA1240308.1 HAD family phosphatase [Chloroflexota bacterium]